MFAHLNGFHQFTNQNGFHQSLFLTFKSHFGSKSLFLTANSPMFAEKTHFGYANPIFRPTDTHQSAQFPTCLDRDQLLGERHLLLALLAIAYHS
jgi:hypothetical protein